MSRVYKVLKNLKSTSKQTAFVVVTADRAVAHCGTRRSAERVRRCLELGYMVVPASQVGEVP